MKKKLLSPLGILAIVAIAWYFLRSKNTQTVTNKPGTSSSGVPAYTPDTNAFLINPPVLAPSPGLTRTGAAVLPNANYGGNGYDFSSHPDLSRLTYNIAPIIVLPPNTAPVSADTKPDSGTPDTSGAPSGCGCGGGCDSCVSQCSSANSRYTDGRGGCMAATRNEQVAQANPRAMPAALANISSFITKVDPSFVAPISIASAPLTDSVM
jgi:hypothetical protein